MVSPLANIHPAVFVSLDCQTFQPRICLTVLSTVLLRAQLEHKVSYTTYPWIKFYGLYCHTVNMYLYMYKMSWLTSCLGKDNQRHATHTQHYAIHPLFTKISVAKLFSSTITLPISTHTHTHTLAKFVYGLDSRCCHVHSRFFAVDFCLGNVCIYQAHSAFKFLPLFLSRQRQLSPNKTDI